MLQLNGKLFNLTSVNHFFYAVCNEEGVVAVSRAREVTKLEIPIRRAKGSQGNITIQWSLYQNQSTHDTKILWPSSGKVALADGKWNDSFILNVANDKKELPESVIWVQLDKTTGGAVLASRDKTTAKIVIAGNEEENKKKKRREWKWIVIGVCGGLLLVLIVAALLWGVRKRKQKTAR